MEGLWRAPTEAPALCLQVLPLSAAPGANVEPKWSQIGLNGRSLEGPNGSTCFSLAGASVECSPGRPNSPICSTVSDNFQIIQPDLAQNGAEFVPANEFADLGYPVSSPSVVEPAGDLDSASAFLT